METRTFQRPVLLAAALLTLASAPHAFSSPLNSKAKTVPVAKLPAIMEIKDASPKIEETLDIAPVWSAHPVGFALLTRGGYQFAAFYDAERHMTVAQRKLGDKTWTLTRLPETTGWDSHNYIALTADADGYLHLSGNMHVHPLVYFKSTKPMDASTLVRVKNLIGTNEVKVTYPIFLHGPKNQFLFTYRDGSSGNGDQIYDAYDEKTKTWHRLLDRPLTDGEGHRNAYFESPKLGPDGYFHMVWVWRESPDASTNHDPSYARSKDMVHWERSDGTPISLPITLKSGEIVDPVPQKGGVVNGNVHIGFDSQKRPIVSYHKYDSAGNIQIYNARLEDGHWKIYQTSDWNWRWDFGGGGTIPFEVGLGPVQTQPDGKLTQRWITTKHGSGIWILDPNTLKPTGSLQEPPAYPPSLTKAQSDFPEMQVKWAGDSGASGEPGVRYVLRWETLGANRDRARTGTLPAPVMLRLYKLRASGS